MFKMTKIWRLDTGIVSYLIHFTYEATQRPVLSEDRGDPQHLILSIQSCIT